jgi:proteasome lid subunit RPN8/RPN11
MMAESKKFEIVCTDELMNKIEEHCFSSTKTEVGGFLVGTVDDGKSIVTHVLKAKHTANTQSQLTFTNKTWETAFAEMSEISGDAHLIGWFHSHPNFGVFLSDYDKFIQNEFFNKDGMITIVVDPINGKRGWFISIDKEVRPYADEEDTKLAKLSPAKTNQKSDDHGVELKNSTAIAIAGFFSLFSLLASFALSGTQGSSIDQIGKLEAQIVSLQQQILEISARLPEKKKDEEVSNETTAEVTPAQTPKTSPSKPKVTASKTTAPSSNAVRDGAACTTANKLQPSNKKTYKCTSVSGKLVWKEVVTPKKTSTPGSGSAGTSGSGSAGTSGSGSAGTSESNNSGTTSDDSNTSNGKDK